MVWNIVETRTAADNPAKPKVPPKSISNAIRDPVLTNTEYPTLVDSFDCNLAFRMAINDKGTIEKNHYL